MAVTWADVSARWPVVATVPLTGQAAYLADAAREVGAPEWGADADRALCAMAAHLALVGLRRAAGQLTSETLGPSSRSYAAPVSAEVLESTTPGLEFLRIRRGIAAFRFPTMARRCW